MVLAGSRKIRRTVPHHLCEAPSIDTLVERLKNRNTETEASLAKRIEKVKREIGYENRFDAVIVNDLLEVAKRRQRCWLIILYTTKFTQLVYKESHHRRNYSNGGTQI